MRKKCLQCPQNNGNRYQGCPGLLQQKKFPEELLWDISDPLEEVGEPQEISALAEFYSSCHRMAREARPSLGRNQPQKEFLGTSLLPLALVTS